MFPSVSEIENFDAAARSILGHAPNLVLHFLSQINGNANGTHPI